MNFDNAKENIQPLACGRDAKRLEIAINAELNDEEAQKELQRQKCEYEERIQNYCGNDPLEIWFEYISWVEQSFPKNGKECSIDELLEKCLLQFGDNTKYFQDIRFIKIYIKFIDSQENPIEIYQQLYNHGIGTMVAEFYIAWAYYYDLIDNFNKANEVYVKGIQARAQPIDDLEQAQKIFSFSIPSRLLNRDEDEKNKFRSTMQDKREALTSLRAHKQKHVGSLRTGNVIKSSKPGKLPSSSSGHTSKTNKVVNIFKDSTLEKADDQMQYLSSQTDTSITYCLIDKSRHKENKKEPGPWSKTNKNRNQSETVPSSSSSLGFSIMVDSDNNLNTKLGEEFAIKLPPNFKRSNLPQSEYIVPLFIAEDRPFSLPRYDKLMLYPGNGEEYSTEELRAWKYFNNLCIQNKFVEQYGQFWTNEGLNLKARIASYVPKKNQKQTDFFTEPQPTELSRNQRMMVCVWKNYDYTVDCTIEDFLAQKWREKLIKNNTIMDISMDETNICVNNSVIVLDETNIVRNVNVESPPIKTIEPVVVPVSDFKIFTDESIVPPPPVQPVENKINFQIFEDKKDVVFKEPQYTGTVRKCIGRSEPINNVEKNENNGGFEKDETCSTKNFLMFIKQEGTSTPVQKKTRESAIPISQQKSHIPIKAIPAESLSSPEMDNIPKQLSIIMETSESNTNTKSSVDENDSTKYLLNLNQTAKSKTINNAPNLSTIRESLSFKNRSERDTTKCKSLGLSGFKLNETDLVTLPTDLITNEICDKPDEMCDLAAKTISNRVSPNSKITNNSKCTNKSFKPVISEAPIVLNDSVTIPSFHNILLHNKCDNTTTNFMGTSIAMPKNQSIMPDFTENISIFAQPNKSKLISFAATTTNTNDDKSFSNQCLEGDLGKSIYEPKQMINDENNLDDLDEMTNIILFPNKIIDLNQTRQQIDDCISAESIDPWNVDLCNAFLENLDFFNYLETSKDCVLVDQVPSLKNSSKIEIAGKLFNSIQYVSKGAYGYIYKGKDVASNKMVALKQERPPNCWEYYISIIITERILIEFLPRFMIVENALIGNNSSVLVSDYVQYGTLIDVCNKVYASTSRNLDELLVMILATELITIVDLLHSADIIHGDIKPDNFLLTAHLSPDLDRPIVKLIDYGRAIDMQRFPINTTFNTAITTEDLICTEMKDGRPWTYQTDLYCLAGTIHVLLFGRYMKTESRFGKVNILTKLPRYFYKSLWERIFTTLLNVPDCQSFPNLQDLKLELKEILAEKQKIVFDKISSFNRIIL